MSNTKSILCLLVIVAAYGIAGHLDYEDAVMLEQAERQSWLVVTDDCLEPEGRSAKVFLQPRGLRGTGMHAPHGSESAGTSAAALPCTGSRH